MGEQINAGDSVREIMARFPAARAVFNRHGLGGCGGAEGPMESVDYFSKAHNIPTEGLLHELNDAVEGGHGHDDAPDACCTPSRTVRHGAESDPGTTDTGYHKFVRGAILLCLLVGCTIGFIMLAYRALFLVGWVGGNPASWWFPHAQAHGVTQLFGWIGLFIMGIAYHVVPRFRGGTLPSRELATASFWLMLSSVLLRMYFQPLAEERWAAHVVIWSAGLGMAAATLFAVVMRKTCLMSPSSPQLHDGYLRWGVRWFLAAAALNCWSAVDLLVRKSSVVQFGLNDALFHIFLVGFTLLFILGVSLRTLPLFLGLKSPSPMVARLALLGINLGVIGYVAGTFHVEWARLASGALVVEAGSVIALVMNLGLLWSGKNDQGFEKFIRAAYGWLLLAALLIAVGGLEGIVDGGAPWAAIRDYRHIVTIGFVSMIIVGMAAKMIPTFEGRPLHSRRMLDIVFWLLNIGVMTRAAAQLGAEYGGDYFHLAVGAAGTAEVLGLLLFSINIWKTLSPPIVVPVPVTADGAIGEEMSVGDIVDRYPKTLDIFVSHGFGHLKNPIFRATMARRVSLRMACGMHRVDLSMMVNELNRCVERSA